MIYPISKIYNLYHTFPFSPAHTEANKKNRWTGTMASMVPTPSFTRTPAITTIAPMTTANHIFKSNKLLTTQDEKIANYQVSSFIGNHLLLPLTTLDPPLCKSRKIADLLQDITLASAKLSQATEQIISTSLNICNSLYCLKEDSALIKKMLTQLFNCVPPSRVSPEPHSPPSLLTANTLSPSVHNSTPFPRFLKTKRSPSFSSPLHHTIQYQIKKAKKKLHVPIQAQQDEKH